MSPAAALFLRLLSTTQQTRPSGGDKTRLLTLGSVPRDGRSLTNMLVVTTTVRMVHRVHGNTTSLGPRVALDSEFMLGARGLQQGLVGTATTSNNTDHTTGAGVDDLLGARGKLDAGLALIGVVADDGDVVAGGTAQGATVTNFLLHVRDDGTFRHGAEGKDIADGKGSLLASVDELTRVHALIGDEGLGDLLVLVRVAENNLGEGSTAAGIVNDLADYTSEVAMAFGVVEVAELGGGLVQARVGREDGSTALALVANDSTHGG
jgi:hypothetical protein